MDELYAVCELYHIKKKIYIDTLISVSQAGVGIELSANDRFWGY